jgi:hypothetical protein
MGYRILHLGDADTNPDAFNNTEIGSIDAAIVPAWFISNGDGRK